MFADRYDAAQKLVPLLSHYKKDPNAIVIAIPRGGVEIGYVIATELHLPLDVMFVKKLTLPSKPEYAIGAVSDTRVFVDKRFDEIPALQSLIEEQIATLRTTLQERMRHYRKGMPPLKLGGKTIIVVDDGVATGNTLLMTLAIIKEYNPYKIVVAIPVASTQAKKMLEQNADEVICYAVPDIFFSVGQFYKQFLPVDDVRALHLLVLAQRV
jgi:putative phosphoribosyl transferase